MIRYRYTAIIVGLLGSLLLSSNLGCIVFTAAFQAHSEIAFRRTQSLASSLVPKQRQLQSYPSIRSHNRVKDQASILPTRRQSRRNSSTLLSATVGGNLVRMMAKSSNPAGVTAAIAVTTTAAIVSLLSWRKTKHLQEELRLLRLKQEIHTNDTTNHGPEQEKKNDKILVETLSSDNQDATKNVKTKQQTNTKAIDSPTTTQLSVNRIGVVRSIYRLCVGTPRQGLLAPDARGRIELDKIGDSSTEAIVDGLQDFGYIWILFHFHLNTKSANPNRKGGRFKSKIAPPALGGKKVGIYATRSPHRHNPIGITLCKLDGIDVRGPHDVTLLVSGLDLVDGTPVLDVKPYVPVYDSVQLETVYPGLELPPPKVPGWVGGGLATRRNVVVTPDAKQELQEILRQNPHALEFYGPQRQQFVKGDANATTTNDNNNESSTVETVIRVIQQVLSIDVRSSHQTKKARKGRSQAERAERVRSKFEIEEQLPPTLNNDDTTTSAAAKTTSSTTESNVCTQQLDNLLIYFTVKEKESKARGSSEGSGAEDEITVQQIRLIPKAANDK